MREMLDWDRCIAINECFATVLTSGGAAAFIG